MQAGLLKHAKAGATARRRASTGRAKAALKRRLGVSNSTRLGSQHHLRAVRQIARRVKVLKHTEELRSRGRLTKHEVLPMRARAGPGSGVYRGDSAERSELRRVDPGDEGAEELRRRLHSGARGLMQILPRRRED